MRVSVLEIFFYVDLINPNYSGKMFGLLLLSISKILIEAHVMSYTDTLANAIYLIFIIGTALGIYVTYKIYNSEDGFR